jgi:hypothetical protein
MGGAKHDVAITEKKMSTTATTTKMGGEQHDVAITERETERERERTM